MPTIAFIESNTTGTGGILAEKALRRGLSVCFLSQAPERYPYVRELMLHPRNVDTGDPEAVQRCLEQQEDLVAVMSSSEYYLETAARAARALGLPGASPEAIAECRDKGRMGAILDAAGVAVPRTVRVTTTDEAAAAWRTLDGPVVVKPVSGSGSLGVCAHQDRDTYDAHVTDLLAVTENERGLPVQPTALVQALIEGAEYSVEMLGLGDDFQTLAVTAKHLGPAPHFLEVGHDLPAPLAPEREARIVSTVRAALEALDLRFGPTHTEVRMRGDTPVVIEVNPRLAGGMIPVLIEQATGVDVLEAVLDVFLGQPFRFAPSRARAASIAFLVPEHAGRLVAVTPPSDPVDGMVDFFVKAEPGDDLVREGSFRDRIGHVITVGETVRDSRARADDARARTTVQVAEPTSPKMDPGSGDTGRLRQQLHPEAMTIIRKVPSLQQRSWELGWLAAIDEAHLVMLGEAELLPAASVRSVLAAIRDLRQSEFAEIADSVAPRGTYLLYEGNLIERLGVELGGITHLGRSRNDINACLFRLRLREHFAVASRSLWRLRSSLLRRAAETTALAMPIYSQFQPGLPGTLAFYFLGVERALARDQRALTELLDGIDTSPMGAGAGGGSTFPIRPERTAALLGFERTCRSALDAVASRDLALRMLAATAISGMHVTRLAQDIQLWTTREHGLLTLPDELAGGSSMMPQKKNPYLLEMIKGRATRAAGHWTNAIANMQRTPFSNSVEVGTEAVSGLADGVLDYTEAARLMALVVLGATPVPERMQRSLDDGVVIAAAVADGLVAKTGAPFRQVHHQVGAAVAAALAEGRSAHVAVESLLAAEDRPDTALGWAHLYEYGGGPGAASTADALSLADRELDVDADQLRACLERWRTADERRREAIDAVLG